jgi:hypothetical protein
MCTGREAWMGVRRTVGPVVGDTFSMPFVLIPSHGGPHTTAREEPRGCLQPQMQASGNSLDNIWVTAQPVFAPRDQPCIPSENEWVPLDKSEGIVNDKLSLALLACHTCASQSILLHRPLPFHQRQHANCQHYQVKPRGQIKMLVDIQCNHQHIAHNPEPPVFHQLA